MGIYLNPDNIDFQIALNSEIYVDKSGFINYTNKSIYTEQRFICVSRPRRFGKSMTANMLVAYYSRGCDSKEMFNSYKIAENESFEKYLNKYNVIHINMALFVNENKAIEKSLENLQMRLLRELKKEFNEIDCYDWSDLISVLAEIYDSNRSPFIFIIDEWDSIFREHKDNDQAQKVYLDFLRDLLKNQSYVALAYMTGILPIKKYGKHSALNMFTEISMTYAEPLSEFTGFTEKEVIDLCEKYGKDYNEMKRWYDGYNVDGISIYNPKSVVESLTRGKFQNFWTLTETYDALRVYIQMNFDGLNSKITSMIAGSKVEINTAKFSNDMITLRSADDVLTLLVHLGYLTYAPVNETGRGEVWIPNGEVQQEFINSIEDGGWESVMKAIKNSDELLTATLDNDTEKIAYMIEKCHQENFSVMEYNSENALSCVITLAYYSARKDYIIHRELPTGKGFADIAFIPKRNRDLPAMVVELKWNKDADTAIEQIKRKQYTEKLSAYAGNILLVGINYDKKTKKHICVVEKVKR